MSQSEKECQAFYITGAPGGIRPMDYHAALAALDEPKYPRRVDRPTRLSRRGTAANPGGPAVIEWR